jgi:hypothetical protein
MTDHGKLDRTRLPLADSPFGGVEGRTLAESKPDWSVGSDVGPPDGAPLGLTLPLFLLVFAFAYRFQARIA